MFYFFKLLLLLINIDQETVLNWFGIESPNLSMNSGNLLTTDIESSSIISLETVKLIVEGLWQRVQDGLTLADIENILFFILFIHLECYQASH